MNLIYSHNGVNSLRNSEHANVRNYHSYKRSRQHSSITESFSQRLKIPAGSGIERNVIQSFRESNESLTIPTYKIDIQFLGAAIVSLGGFMIGNVFGWSSPAQQFLLEMKITSTEYSWISSISAAGGAISQLWILLLLDRIGRKWTIIYLSIPTIFSWISLGFANTYLTYMLARFSLGLFVGGMYVACPTYIAEISRENVKGLLTFFFHLYFMLGVLYTYIFGFFFNNLRWASFSPVIIPLILILTLIFIPKSPLFLVQQGRESEARAALKLFHGQAFNIDREITRISEIKKPQKNTFFKALKLRSYRRSFFMLIMMSIIQQFSGYVNVIFYSHQILNMAGTTIDPNISALVIAITQFLVIPAVYFAFGKYGRKLLWYMSLTTMCFGFTVVGLYFTIKLSNPIKGLMNWIPTIALAAYVTGFCIGCGPLLINSINELVPFHTIPSTSVAVAFFNWTLIFGVTQSFESLHTMLGMHYLFFMHAMICGLANIIVLLYIIETKNKSFDEIKDELNKNSIFTI